MLITPNPIVCINCYLNQSYNNNFKLSISQMKKLLYHFQTIAIKFYELILSQATKNLDMFYFTRPTGRVLKVTPHHYNVHHVSQLYYIIIS